MKLFGKELTFNGNKIYHTGNKPTASEIGAAASSHTHSYLPLSGGTMSGTASIEGLKELRFSEGACLIQTTGFAGLSISANPLTINVSDFVIKSPHFNLTSSGEMSVSTFAAVNLTAYSLGVYGSAVISSSLTANGNASVGGTLKTTGAIYGSNNIALANGSIYCGTVGASLTCDYLRINTNIIGSDSSKRIHLIDSGGNGAAVYAGSVWANSGSWSDMSLKENIRRVANSEAKTANLDIINENQETLDTSYDITRLEMFDFIKDKLSLCLFNYKQQNENNEYEKTSFDNKIGFIANEVSEDRVGRTFVGEQDGKLAYSLNNYVFLLTGALQEEIRKRELLEEKVAELYTTIK